MRFSYRLPWLASGIAATELLGSKGASNLPGHWTGMLYYKVFYNKNEKM